MRTDSLTYYNDSVFVKVRSPSGIEEHMPRIIDITSGNLQDKPKRKFKYKKWILWALLALFLLGLLLASILLPILLSNKKGTTNSTTPYSITTSVKTTPVITTRVTTTVTTTIITTTVTTMITTLITCIYPNVITPLNTCVNVQIDSDNCGEVGNICPSNTSCSAGVCTNVPGIQLKNPIPIWSASTNGTADDQMYDVALPWSVTLYGTTTDHVVVTTDGVSSYTNTLIHVKYNTEVLCLGTCSTTYAETTLPSDAFSSATAFPFWDDLFIYANTSQGIYYQSEGTAPNRQLIFEYYMSHYLQATQYYHFQVTFFENAPGVVQFKYLDATDGGMTCTVGVQGTATGPFILYSYDQANAVQQNLVITLDTNLGTYTTSNG
ncbi:unnamed protein product [Adineta steineri]|uniref:Uncharacterized protein n=1 Tax=Adineta steineri TaxID=433720 RepID=A0A813YSE3_9BILA|nr:unnamed protein product [Adineta steineri]